MRAIQINEENVVVNFAEVMGFSEQFLETKSAVDGQHVQLGATYDPDTQTFTNPPTNSE